jgi:hypothetical protein
MPAVQTTTWSEAASGGPISFKTDRSSWLTTVLMGREYLYHTSFHLVQWIKQGLLLQFRPCQNDYQAYSILGCMFSSF